MQKLAFAFATCGMLLGSPSRASAAPYAPKVGQRHPDFTLPTIGDRTPGLLVELSRQKGAAHPVRLMVNWLPPARASLARSDSRVGEARPHWHCWASPRSNTPTAAGCLPSGSSSTGRSFTTRSICWRHRPCRSSWQSTSMASSGWSGRAQRQSRLISLTRRLPTTRRRVIGDRPVSPTRRRSSKKPRRAPAPTHGAVGDALTIWGGVERVDQAIDAYTRAVTLDPSDKNSWFRLGVARRIRHESAGRRPGDFQAAIDAWGRALELDPNQYIWRRRIEQYGPRLTKPYAFYDWVVPAKAEISRRGETPVPLAIEPYGSELAGPVRDVVAEASAPREPDPAGADPKGR